MRNVYRLPIIYSSCIVRMFATNICKVYFHTCNRKCTTIYFSTTRLLIDNVTINNSHLIDGRSYIHSSLSSRKGQAKNDGLFSLKTRFSTGNYSLGSISEDAREIGESCEAPLDALTYGPPEELFQSLGEENRQKLKLLWEELQVIKRKGHGIPKKMSSLQWQEALTRDTHFKKIKYLQYLCRKETYKKRKDLKKKANFEESETARLAHELKKANDTLINKCDLEKCKNTIFLPFSKNKMNTVYNSWQCQAIQFGQSIVIDLGLDDQMSKWEAFNCANQIAHMYGFNRENRHPFYIHLCNASPNNQVLQFVEQCIPNLYSHMCMIKITEESYLDVFPKEKLVYLSPHCKNELINFDHHAVYIIGGMVDKVVKRPVSENKAKMEGISVACLPLDHYLPWRHGTKSLTLDQMIKIMLDIKNTDCWATALKHVPTRKLKKD